MIKLKIFNYDLYSIKIYVITININNLIIF